MAAVFAFLGMLLISIVVALLAALQLGDFFRANDEFILIIAGVAGLTAVSWIVFALAYAVARSTRMLNAVALALGVLAFAPAVLPGLIQKIADRSTNPGTVGIENTYITIELIVPVLAAVLVQWGLVRRRWLRAAGGDDLSLWPWVTTAIAGLVILNPLGLSLLQATLKHSASDFLWQLEATVTVSTLGVLLVMVWIECYIRDRVLRRRLQARPQNGATVQESSR
jgi:hypothetical protein